MSSRGFQFAIERLEPGTRVILEGALDEGATLKPMLARIAAPVVIDLSRIRFVDSVGVREWVDFLRALPRPVSLQRCSEALVYQFGMVRETLQDARVESFLAPFECEGCGRERRVEIRVGAEVSTWRDVKLPEPTCEGCQGRMVLAEHPERYLFFLGE